MSRKHQARVTIALGVGLLAGFFLHRIPVLERVLAQDVVSVQVNTILVQGYGRAISSLRPPGEHFTLTSTDASFSSFKAVPAGKKFVLTDVIYHPQGSVREGLTVNIAEASPSGEGHRILTQIRLEPGRSEQLHMCSGFVINSGRVLAAFTNAGLEPGQYVSISVTGHLINDLDAK